MTTVTWLPRADIMGGPAPQQYGAAENGVPFVMVRELATGTRWRISVFPSGDPNESIEAQAGSEAQAKRMVERWARVRTIDPRRVSKARPPAPAVLPPRKPKGADDRS